MTKMRWALLGVTVIVSTVLGLYLVIHSGLNWGWHFEIPAWFVAWLVIFFIVKRNWLYSIAAVIMTSVLEDALFLLWCRIDGTIPWSAPFYGHDWIPFCQNWGGIPSYYFYAILVAGILVYLGHRRRVRLIAQKYV